MKASPKTIKIFVKILYAVNAIGIVLMIAIGQYLAAFVFACISLSVFYSFDRTKK